MARRFTKLLPAQVRSNNLGLHITPNYSGRLTQSEIREELPEIEFTGPGIYFVKSPSGNKLDSVLIVADMTKPRRLWKKNGWFHKVKFLVSVWTNYDVSITCMLLNQAPVRRDDRD